MLKKINCFIFSKFILTITQIILQSLIIVWLLLCFQDYILWILLFTYLINLGITFIILNKNDAPSYQIAWILLLFLLPVVGGIFYIEIHCSYKIRKIRRKLSVSHQKLKQFYENNHLDTSTLKQEDRSFFQLTSYLKKVADFPLYTNENTKTKYYPFGEDQWKDMLKDLKLAKHFIFLEYFTIEQGLMWDEILSILKAKVNEGVEVRVMYDGVCSMTYLPYQYKKRLAKAGIKVKIFSPIPAFFSSLINYRDHRKICIIDNKIAYTGGANIGDEYINVKKKKGVWKDNGIKLEGIAVKTFTLLYLEMWNDLKDSIEKYMINGKSKVNSLTSGYILPFGDNPLDHIILNREVYLDMLHQAKTSIQIMSPYLILDHDLLNTLLYLSRKGIEISLFLPGIPDKKSIYWLGKTYNEKLIENGIKIFEYQLGFLHAKTLLIDQEKAVVSTINLDYRSFYLQFEDGCIFYNDPIISEISKDFEKTKKNSALIQLEEVRKRSWISKVVGKIYRLFSPFC